VGRGGLEPPNSEEGRFYINSLIKSFILFA
jgi:hypothetical protein